MCRDGVEVYGDDVSLDPQETRPLLLQVPPGYNPGDAYRLRIEGYHRWAEALLIFIPMIPSMISRYGGATIFNNETSLYFSNKFLSITISTNQVVYTAVHTMRVSQNSYEYFISIILSYFQIRVIMLKTDLLPYDNVADLFIIDPDGFIIRKWNSKQLNNGLMTAEFQVKIRH